MTVPAPSSDPPHPIEVQARVLHAAELRVEHPGTTDQAVLAAWSNLSDRQRRWFLDEAQRQFEERLAVPAEPDDVEALTRRLTGMSPDEVRAAGAELRVQRGDHLQVRTDDGDVHDLVALDDAEVGADGMVTFPAADAAAHEVVERIVALGANRLRSDVAKYQALAQHADAAEAAGTNVRFEFAGPSITEAPEHRAARQRTDAEQAALAPPARVGRWVAGQGWVPVDGLGPYEGSAQ